MQATANEIFGIFERQGKGEFTYAKALEMAAGIMEKAADQRPIVGYIKSGEVKRIFTIIFEGKKPESFPVAPYQYTCLIHHNDMEVIRRILKK